MPEASAAPGPGDSLSLWLAYLEGLDPSRIQMGLERVQQVIGGLYLSTAFPVITVAGTNGKGSTCALLEAILLAAGYRVGCYLSPHLERYNERVRVGGRELADAAFCESFARLEQVRGDTPLTYFEFGTLAAVLAFEAAAVDVAILEVGLGGRLDAVNAFDAHCAIITSIDLDHQDYLGPTREHIGREKAGVFRAGRPAIINDPAPPASLLDYGATLGADLRLRNRDYRFQMREDSWSFEDAHGRRNGLPLPALRGEHQVGNAAAALAALGVLREALPVDGGAIRRGLVEVSLPARFQVLPGRPVLVLDVAHNPHAAASLRRNLVHLGLGGRTFAVFGMLRDKDAAGVVDLLSDLVDRWFLVGLEGPRGRAAEALAEVVRARAASAGLSCFSCAGHALRAARAEAAQDDKIIVFGSFHTVADALVEIRRPATIA